jgi:hypothetical protein
MTAPGQPESRSEPKKLEAIIFLSSNRPLHLPDFLAEFQRNWPLHMLEKTGVEPHRAFFRAGRSDFALELHHTPVPHAITDPVANSTLDWPAAAAALASHVAYIELTGSALVHGALTLACDLTRAIASLLPVTDSLAVCWLNGPALNRAKTFISTAHEMFSTGLYPLTLWVAVRWDADSHTLSTHGMEQFNAPDLILAQQPDPAPLMVDYLFQLALSLLTSSHPITAGGTVEGPHGLLKISQGNPSQTGRKGLLLEPAR